MNGFTRMRWQVAYSMDAYVCWHVGQEKGLILHAIQEADKIIASLKDRE